ncbi:MAG: glycosyl transferase [Planctomycetes bacterium B3_Pla]|nr:MAG: glycosyl transferase [Planctomycetes bacterium B3_Pla]
MRLGIDASNIRSGGGVTHLDELLRAAEPQEFGFDQVIVWGCKSTLHVIEDRPWLCKAHEPLLDRALPARLYWQRFILDRLAHSAGCTVLFVPGGSYGGAFKPFVTMSQNMLPFESCEAGRFGFSWPRLRYHLLRLLQSSTFLRAQGVIFLSDYARKVVKGALNGEVARDVVIPHGVDTRFLCQPRKQKDISDYSPQNPFRILYVSIVNLYKHQWNVAEAVSRLRRTDLPVEVDFVGPSSPRALRRLKAVMTNADSPGEYIHYTGAVPFDQLHSTYHQADAFVFASSCENLPNILLEAMAAGLPIACSNQGPMPEILGDAGVYFNPEQPDEIAQALYSLVNDTSLRERCAWSAHEKAQQYSWSRCANETFDFLAQFDRRK